MEEDWAIHLYFNGVLCYIDMHVQIEEKIKNK
jgi:hypothetical protein